MTCYPVMGSNITFVLSDFGVRCGHLSSFGYSGSNQPLVDSNGNCYGFHGLPTEMCCTCARADVRRVCRCKEPSELVYIDYFRLFQTRIHVKRYRAI